MPPEADPLGGVALSLAREGRVEVEVPSESAVRRKGPASREAPVFYNSATELGRDASVAVLRVVGKAGWRALDGLAGSGVRGVRYAVEGPSGLEVTLNDADPLAAALCARNAARNGVMGARVTQAAGWSPSSPRRGSTSSTSTPSAPPRGSWRGA